MRQYPGLVPIDNIYIVLTNPYNVEDDQPITAITGIEFRIVIPDGSALVVSTTMENGNFIDVGDQDSNSHMALLDQDRLTLRAIYPNSGDYSVPVFEVN